MSPGGPARINNERVKPSEIAEVRSHVFRIDVLPAGTSCAFDELIVSRSGSFYVLLDLNAARIIGRTCIPS